MRSLRRVQQGVPDETQSSHHRRRPEDQLRSCPRRDQHRSEKGRRLHHTRCLGRKGAHAGPRNTAFSLSGENIFIPLDFSFDESLGILSF